MKASFTAQMDGSFALNLDHEAAHALFASVIFAARFHDGIAPLAPMAERALNNGATQAQEGSTICQ